MKVIIDPLIAELKKKHGDELELSEHHYFLFLKDGVFNIYIDEDEKELKVDVVFSDVVKVYHSENSMEGLIDLKNS